MCPGFWLGDFLSTQHFVARLIFPQMLQMCLLCASMVSHTHLNFFLDLVDWGLLFQTFSVGIPLFFSPLLPPPLLLPPFFLPPPPTPHPLSQALDFCLGFSWWVCYFRLLVLVSPCSPPPLLPPPPFSPPPPPPPPQALDFFLLGFS